MIDDEIHFQTKHLLTSYLSFAEAGPWSIQGACLSARTTTAYGVPADSVATRLLIEEHDQGWAVAIEVVRRCGKLWRIRIENYFDDGGRLGSAGVRVAYRDWLRSL